MHKAFRQRLGREIIMEMKEQTQQSGPTADLQAKFYSKAAWGYDAFNFIMCSSSFYRYIASDLEGERALEVACGTGILSLLMSPNFTEVVGVDVATGMVEVARKKAKNKGITNIDFKLAQAENLPFDDNYFDVVVCLNAIGSLEDDIKVISEMKRVLKPKGILRFNTYTRVKPRIKDYVWYLPAKLYALKEQRFKDVEYLEHKTSPRFIDDILKELPGAETSRSRDYLGILLRPFNQNIVIDWIK